MTLLAGVMESGAALRCLELFTRFAFNNLLHHRVHPRCSCMPPGAAAQVAALPPCVLTLGRHRLPCWVIRQCGRHHRQPCMTEQSMLGQARNVGAWAQVAGLLVTGLERGSERLVDHLFSQGRLIGWLTSAPERVARPPPVNGSSRSGAPCFFPPVSGTVQSAGCSKWRRGAPDGAEARSMNIVPDPDDLSARLDSSGLLDISSAFWGPHSGCAGQRGPLRAGYMGHVTALGVKLGELARQRVVIAHALGASEAWAAWQQGVLQPRSETENVYRRVMILP